MSAEYDNTELSAEADRRIKGFQPSLLVKRTFSILASHSAYLPHHCVVCRQLAKEYFGAAGMLGYVEGVQRKEIRQGIACVKHQNMSGSDIGDDHKELLLW